MKCILVLIYFDIMTNWTLLGQFWTIWHDKDDVEDKTYEIMQREIILKKSSSVFPIQRFSAPVPRKLVHPLF